MPAPKLVVPIDRIAEFCRRWKITELALFGSVLRDDFRPDSDVDVLVTFAPDAPWSLYEWADMMDELKAIFGREVDLVEKDGLRNPFRRHAILSTRQVIYAACTSTVTSSSSACGPS
jgi:predicted nucleotidyltransferase